MRQSELIDQLAETTGLNRKQVKLFLTELASLAQREVRLTGEFTLPDWGRSCVLNAHPGWDVTLATGEQINIPARSTISLKSANL